ncbi:unnamed protein product [Effrenium voratum]|nr:unnamed protein product [Effrenium voratum]|mmetsp:Transcript_46755/g.111151  ORF Transcript_46755/g.111151 Transcript_46755/m.111151 type:complete len:142 (-) Transcript_46755:75-500(-)
MAQNPGQNMLEIKGDVAHRLEANGALDQIRAQMRANVYRALLGDQEDSSEVSQQDGPEAPKRMVSVVNDFLENWNLSMTKEVFLRETSQQPLLRDELVKELAAASLEPPLADQAILEQVLAAAQKRRHLPETIPEECRSGF